MDFWFTSEDIAYRLQRLEGICTSVVMTDQQNAERIKGVLNAFLAGVALQEATRTSDDWHRVLDLPNDFSNARFRVAR